jgi:hypothetical protein
VHISHGGFLEKSHFSQKGHKYDPTDGTEFY